jgi:hypothetical protein
MTTAAGLIEALQLRPHPEGGHYRETYRATALLPGGSRSVATAIYFLLAQGERSRLHRIDADEIWHFYEGDPLRVVELVPGVGARITPLGRGPGLALQHVVRAGVWFGALPAEGSRFSLVGCTVSPAFEFAGFELATRAAMLDLFPEERPLIEALTAP